jgi:hypothetical protein
MKTKLLLLLLFLLPIAVIAQDRPRQILNGRVVADSLKVEGLSVYNVSSHIGAVTDKQGSFTIYARPKDTLFFSSVSYRSVRLVLSEKDILERPLIIKLDVNYIMLDEVVITPTTLTGKLDKDSKNTKIRLITSGMDSYQAIQTDTPRPKSNVNTALPSSVTGSALTGVNLGQVFNLFFKKRKRKDAGEIYGTKETKPFSVAAKERFTYYFFTEMLKIPKDEIGLFLNFCDKGKESYALLDPKKEFELTDYLVAKSKEYLEKDK